MGRILVVDDEPGVRAMLEVVLRRDGHEVEVAANGMAALARIQAVPAALPAGGTKAGVTPAEPAAALKPIDVVLCDLRMDGLSGLEVLANLRSRAEGPFVIIMTAFAEWDTAVRAMRLGAYNFLRKPFDNTAVRVLVNRALAAREHHVAAKAAGETARAVHLVGSSATIHAIQALIEQVSTTDSTVLVTGESGTGKELVANALHYASLRSDGPLVRINSGALARNLLESELFGHRKGAFTGAVEDRQGLFAFADKGTLFLDEVGELAPETQVKLLRVLESGEYVPVGGREPLTCDVRLVAATNRDLSAMVRAGTFREDLYYRLAVIPIHLAALRERREDIPLLAGHLLARHAVKLRRGVTGFTRAALDAMLAHAWPGNVRELDNCIQRGVALTAQGDIDVGALFGALAPGGVQPPGGVPLPGPTTAAATISGSELVARLGRGESIDLEREVERFERALVEAALTRGDNNLTETAKLLGISFRQIRYKVRQLGLR